MYIFVGDKQDATVSDLARALNDALDLLTDKQAQAIVEENEISYEV